MEITTAQIKELRNECGAGIMDCRNALKETGGDKAKALEMIQKAGLLAAKKTEGRIAVQGLIEAYIHAGGRIGSLIEINTETDFAARTNEFKDLAHNVAMQVAAMDPQFICKEEAEGKPECGDLTKACLLMQPYIKDPTKTIQDVVNEVIAKTGENIKITHIARFELSKKAEQ